MPPLLWTILEILFGLWVFRNRHTIRRVFEFVFAPPPLTGDRLPDSDQMPIVTGVALGGILGLIVGLALTLYVDSNAASRALLIGSMFGGMSLGALVFQRGCVRSLAPNQPWRVLTESLAARAGIQNVTVRMARSKSRQIRVGPKGVVTLPSALLRTATPDELAFHIGRALWEMHSGYAKKVSKNLTISVSAFLFTVSITLLLFHGDFIFLTISLSSILIFFRSIFFREPYYFDSSIQSADQFALGLTGDLSTALRIIETEEERRATSTADIRQGLRARQNGYERARRLSEWWTLQQRPVSSPVAQATSQVQRLGKP